MPKSHRFLAYSVFTSNRRKVRLTVMAVNRLTRTPIASVRAKPLMMLAPKFMPNQKRMAQVMSVEALESRMDVQARAKPASMAAPRVLPARSSSFMRSKMRILASTAIPMLKNEAGYARERQSYGDQLEQGQGNQARR